MDVARFQELPVWRVGDAGVLLGDRHDNVILPPEEAPRGVAPGDVLRVFVTTDKGDHLVATLATPAAQAGELAPMRVVGTNAHGVFVDWGLPKDLFVPWKHQHTRLEEGDLAVVFVGVDPETDRPVGFTKLIDVLQTDTHRVKTGQAVSLLVFGFNEVGALCVVDGTWSGLLYRDHVGRRRLKIGESLDGFVERVRDDGKLDLSLSPPGRAGTRLAVDVVWDAIDQAGGFLPLHDKSDPALIRSRLGLSKKQFKKAVGALYKERRIVIEDDGIRRVLR